MQIFTSGEENTRKRLRRFQRCFAFPVLLGLLILTARLQGNAQLLYGSIVGTVTDNTTAVVPGATVTVKQMQTGETRSGVTNDSGAYIISTVPAGTYNVSISKAGFKIFDASDVTAEDLEQLPQPTRSYQGLVALLPGVLPPSASSGGTNNPIRSMIVQANGTSASGTNVSIDGVSATNPWVQFFSTAVPSTEAVEAVNVVTASSGADQGAVNGAGIHVQIKSGPNSFHGERYEYFENNTLQAKPFFQPAGTRNPKYIDNDFGGTVGGPIMKDKLFFFASYEVDRLRQAA